MVGVGFAFTENILYLAAAYIGGDGAVRAGSAARSALFVVRGIFSPFAHPLFTAFIGIGVGIAVVSRQPVGAVPRAAGRLPRSRWLRTRPGTARCSSAAATALRADLRVRDGARRSCCSSAFAVWARRREGALLTAALDRLRPARASSTRPRCPGWSGSRPAARRAATPRRSAARGAGRRWRSTSSRRSSSASCTTATCAAPHRPTSPSAGQDVRRRDARRCARTCVWPATAGRNAATRATSDRRRTVSDVDGVPTSRRAQMLTTLVRLREALAAAHAAAGRARRRGAPQPRARDDRPARRLRPAAAGPDRRAAADRRRRLDRRRQVDPGQLAGRPPGHRARRAPPDHPLAGAGAQPRRRRLVRQGPDPARPERTDRRDRRPGRAAAGRRPTTLPAGPGHPRRARHRLGRGAQPDAGRPAARRRRPVAVRHLGRALRRPGAVGLPQAGRRAQHRGRDRARPHRRRRPSPRSAATWPGCSPPAACATRRCSPCPRATSTTTGCCPRPTVARDPGLAGRARRRRRRARRGRQADPRRRGPLARRRSRTTVADARRSSRSTMPARLRDDVDQAYDDAVDDDRRRLAPTAPCCAARCWPAGRSSSAPASCSAAWRPRSAGCATGSATRSRASRSRPAG